MTGKKDRSSENEKLWQEGVDSKALLVCLIKKLPVLLLLALTGAIIGGGLNLVLALYKNATPVYYNQKQYYIENYPDCVVEKGNIDELILMMIKGENNEGFIN